jgi:hypothetical protein
VPSANSTWRAQLTPSPARIAAWTSGAAWARLERLPATSAASAFASSAAAEITRLGLAEDREAAAEEGDDARAKASAQELAHRRQVAKRLGEQLKLLVECADGLRARRARVQQLIAPRLGPMDGFGLCELPTPSEIAAQLAQSAVVQAGEEQSEEEAEEEAEAEEDAATRPAGGAAATKTTPAAARRTFNLTARGCGGEVTA